ncbi:MAG: TatD family hydrolase [Gammaproteobacteria bacterium]|nr:TatD family hydrolase [Gammaproteobacteria bacterium]MBU1980504.1 TatD family hydrolase [Gammaproteobacteria bacterium]
MLIDTHCHLDAAEFDADRDDVAARAHAAGVEAIVVPGVERAGFAKLLATCARYPGCVPALGIHPMYVDGAQPEDLTTLREMIVMHHPVAIGEIGLDFFVPDYDRERQEFYFTEQLKIAREFDLPVLLHIRRAQDTVLKFLRLAKVKGGIAHAFNGSHQQAEEFIKLGFKLGFGGAMTYDRATKLRELAATLPLDSIVLETDAPDIPPAFIGKARNSPEYLPRIAETLAELRGMPVAEVVEATTANAKAILKGLA